MNTLIQTIIVFTALAFAVLFIVRKFFIKSPKTDKGCGTGSDCSCH